MFYACSFLLDAAISSLKTLDPRSIKTAEHEHQIYLPGTGCRPGGCDVPVVVNIEVDEFQILASALPDQQKQQHNEDDEGYYRGCYNHSQHQPCK